MKLSVFSDTENRQGKEILLYLKKRGQKTEHQVNFFNLNDAQMEPCTGCFDCWTRTPGLCIFHDDATRFLKEEVNSDRVLYLCPVTWGGYSPSLKILQDRSLARVLPFFKNINGETHHPSRYDNNPLPYLVGYGNELEGNEIELFKRTGQNMDDNIHKGGIRTIIIQQEKDFSLMDSFFDGVEV